MQNSMMIMMLMMMMIDDDDCWTDLPLDRFTVYTVMSSPRGLSTRVMCNGLYSMSHQPLVS
jgi:hypothetical protein